MSPCSRAYAFIWMRVRISWRSSCSWAFHWTWTLVADTRNIVMIQGNTQSFVLESTNNIPTQQKSNFLSWRANQKRVINELRKINGRCSRWRMPGISSSDWNRNPSISNLYTSYIVVSYFATFGCLYLHVGDNRTPVRNELLIRIWPSVVGSNRRSATSWATWR